MRIRLALEEDLFAINAIYNQAVDQKYCTAHLSPLSQSQQASWFKKHDPARYPVFVSIVDKQVTGWMSIGAYRIDRQALNHVAEVSYYVDKTRRGEGIGTLLLKHAILHAPDFGFSVLVAILLGRNQASIGLLEKLEFSCWGTMPGIAKIDNQEVDHLYYGLKL
jgi:L-amino acid N-acyltransferase YncA